MTNHVRTLLVGGTGKTGRRIGARLAARGVPFRVTSRAGELPFDWHSPGNWSAVLEGIATMYVAYAPDLSMPGAAEQLGLLGVAAARAGVKKVVLLSGRGEPDAVTSEDAMIASGLDVTVLRAARFAQNFSEGQLLGPVLAGTIALPGDAPEPFVDAEDLADVAALCLTSDGHAGKRYDLTGPRLVAVDDAARAIGEASGRAVSFARVTRAEFTKGASAALPIEVATFLGSFFEALLDGHNAHVSDDITRLLGRPARDFSAFVADAARAGAWRDVDRVASSPLRA